MPHNKVKELRFYHEMFSRRKKKSLAVDVDVDHDQNDIVLRETEKD